MAAKAGLCLQEWAGGGPGKMKERDAPEIEPMRPTAAERSGRSRGAGVSRRARDPPRGTRQGFGTGFDARGDACRSRGAPSALPECSRCRHGCRRDPGPSMRMATPAITIARSATVLARAPRQRRETPRSGHSPSVRDRIPTCKREPAWADPPRFRMLASRAGGSRRCLGSASP